MNTIELFGVEWSNKDIHPGFVNVLTNDEHEKYVYDKPYFEQ